MHPFLNMGVLRDPDPNAAGGGGATPPAFDMNAFFTRFEKTLDTKLSALKPPPVPDPAVAAAAAAKATTDAEAATTAAAKATADADAAAVASAAASKKPLLDPRITRLEEQLAAEKHKREDTEKKSEEKDRHGNVRGLLSDFQFAGDRAREDAFRTFASEIKRGEDGETLVGPTGEPAAEYIRKMLEGDRDYLLKTRDLSGSGATNTGVNRVKPIDLNDIKPGMKPEDLERARVEISRVALAALRGQ